MHSSCTDRPMYTGAPMFGFAPPVAGPMMGHHHHHPEAHGFCHSCCHPRSHCMCGHRQCRREARELVVNSDDAATKPVLETGGQATVGLLKSKAETIATNIGTHEIGVINRQVAKASAFIGGGCCVHISVEYIANDPTLESLIMVTVVDSEGTGLRWSRDEPAGTPYRIKEGIITTKPGARLVVSTQNATARVRWCEIFSC